MKKLVLIVLTGIIFHGHILGQIRARQTFFELQFGVGPTFMLTDIGNVGYGANAEVSGKYRLHPRIALKFSLGGGLGMGSDAGTENESRGMSYYSYMAELTGQIEYYILKEGRGAGRGGLMGYKPRVRPYIFAGGGPLLFFPTHTQDNAEELPEFNPYTVIMVGGAGFLYRLNNDIFLGFQAGGRFSTTDFLDGFSPAASTSNDTYITTQLLLLYRF